MTHYAVTNKRIILQSGIIGRDFKSIDYDKIQNVSVNKGIVGVIFNVGNLRIFTGEFETISFGKHGRSRTKSKHDILRDISDPYNILKDIQSHLSKRKENLYAGRT